MPHNKRESFIYTVIMCITMVLWMSIYNVTLHTGTFNAQVIKDAWLGFPIAYVFAACMDWFVVSGLAKGFAFKYLLKPDSSTLRKVISVSCSMVVPMVIIMSLYGAVEASIRMGDFSNVLFISIAILNEFSVEDFYSNIRSSPFSSFHIIKSRDVIVVKLVTISTFVSDFHCVLLIFLRYSTVKFYFS